VNEEQKICHLTCDILNYVGFADTNQDHLVLGDVVPQQYRPSELILAACTYPTVHGWIDTSGNIYGRSSAKVDKLNFIISTVWHY